MILTRQEYFFFAFSIHYTSIDGIEDEKLPCMICKISTYFALHILQFFSDFIYFQKVKFLTISKIMVKKFITSNNIDWPVYQNPWSRTSCLISFPVAMSCWKYSRVHYSICSFYIFSFGNNDALILWWWWYRVSIFVWNIKPNLQFEGTCLRFQPQCKQDPKTIVWWFHIFLYFCYY